jgi:hypothetical protein
MLNLELRGQLEAAASSSVGREQLVRADRRECGLESPSGCGSEEEDVFFCME